MIGIREVIDHLMSSYSPGDMIEIEEIVEQLKSLKIKTDYSESLRDILNKEYSGR